MTPSILNEIEKSRKRKKKLFATLLDPDKLTKKDLATVCKIAMDAKVDYFFIGGSLLTDNTLGTYIHFLKKNSSIPVVLFPGSLMQVNMEADALLFLSLISGRNAEMLIGKHVESAPLLRKSGLEVIPTGYILIESGSQTAVSYMSNTTPIPHNKTDIAICTAMAGEMLGLKVIFMDAGSGAKNPIDKKMIEGVRKHISVPLFIGGGITTPDKAMENCRCGADLIVVGNSIEKDKNLISEISSAIHSV